MVFQARARAAVNPPFPVGTDAGMTAVGAVREPPLRKPQTLIPQSRLTPDPRWFIIEPYPNRPERNASCAQVEIKG